MSWTSAAKVLFLVGGYVLLTWVVLPRMGVPT